MKTQLKNYLIFGTMFYVFLFPVLAHAQRTPVSYLAVNLNANAQSAIAGTALATIIAVTPTDFTNVNPVAFTGATIGALTIQTIAAPEGQCPVVVKNIAVQGDNNLYSSPLLTYSLAVAPRKANPGERCNDLWHSGNTIILVTGSEAHSSGPNTPILNYQGVSEIKISAE